jgi:hypothetical protein
MSTNLDRSAGADQSAAGNLPEARADGVSLMQA